MKFTLLSSDQKNASFSLNDDGTIKITGVRIQVGIVDAPEGKFIQVDLPVLTAPSGTVANDIPAFIDSAVIQYVKDTYPDTK